MSLATVEREARAVAAESGRSETCQALSLDNNHTLVCQARGLLDTRCCCTFQRVILKLLTWRSSSFAFASCSKCSLTGSRTVFSAAARLAFRSPGWILSAR